MAYGWTTQTGKDIQADLRIVPFSGGESAPHRVVYRKTEMAQIRPFGWTPDAKQVLVLRSLKGGTNQIAMVLVEDGSIRVIKSVPWSYTAMSLSPDGKYIAYDGVTGNSTAANEIIFVLAADGSAETQIVHGPDKNGFPVWSHDGAPLLFLSDRTGSMSL